jgi:hypothetical protein
MRISPFLTVGAALVALIVVSVIGLQLVQPNRPLLADVSLSPSKITPDANGADDITLVRYTLNRQAEVSITFTNKATGQEFRFRDNATRPADTYEVYFSGVVDGYTLPGETVEGDIVRRLVPNGDYTWTIKAVGQGETVSQTGDLIVADADSALPVMQSLDVTPRVFTPNQDGYDDRIKVNVYLTKKATLAVYLQGADGVKYDISEYIEGRKIGDPGAHLYDYDGGVDNNLTPPPDGSYTLVAEAQDLEGQLIRRTSEVTIKDGGLPNAEIVAQGTGRTVTWAQLPYEDAYLTTASVPGKKVEPPQAVQSTLASITLPQSDLLVFQLTVSNYGTTPIRTVGPWPGTVYQYDQTNAAMLTAQEQPTGAWRIGVECERSESSYPWRWAIGSQDSLTKVVRENETLWYLMPGQQATVWGAVRMTRLIPTRNPQKCYAALIHEDVAIPPLQSGVGSIDVKLTTPGQ